MENIVEVVFNIVLGTSREVSVDYLFLHLEFRAVAHEVLEVVCLLKNKFHFVFVAIIS